MIGKLGNDKRCYRGIALGFVIFSFLLYAVMPFNLCLPFSYCVITGITVTMVALSEVLFWICGIMLGKEAVKKLREKVSIKCMMEKWKDRWTRK